MSANGVKINWHVWGKKEKRKEQMLRRLLERAPGWIACLPARAQCKLLGEMVLLPQGLNGTLVRAAETELSAKDCHFRADFREAAEGQGFAPLSDQPSPASVCVPLQLPQRRTRGDPAGW